MERKKFLGIFIGIIIIALVMVGCFLKSNFDLRSRIKSLESLKDGKIQEAFQKEREKIKKGLDEKYRADLVSYRAMQKRAEKQNEKIRDLENELEKPEEEN